MPFSLTFDPHQILGISTGASSSEVREAYYRAAKKYHPDRGGDEWAFRVITTAYETLNDKPYVQVSRASEPAAAAPTPEESVLRPESEPPPGRSDRLRPGAGNNSRKQSIDPIQFNWDVLRSQKTHRSVRASLVWQRFGSMYYGFAQDTRQRADRPYRSIAMLIIIALLVLNMIFYFMIGYLG